MSAQVLAFRPNPLDAVPAKDVQQATGTLGEYMLMELVLEVARGSGDPQGRLAELFDRITTRARVGLNTDTSVAMQFRKHAETFFMMAAKNV